eukprot:946367-Pyramimonas_sp.AAC.1
MDQSDERTRGYFLTMDQSDERTREYILTMDQSDERTRGYILMMDQSDAGARCRPVRLVMVSVIVLSLLPSNQPVCRHGRITQTHYACAPRRGGLCIL